MPKTATGSCSCGSVQYTIEEEIKSVVNCHCNMCKRMSGSAFSAIALIREQSLDVTTGRDKIAAYAISDKATKHFCSICGSPVYHEHKAFPGHYMLPIGTLDEPAVIDPAMNVFCESMLPWVKNIAGLKCFDQLPQK